MMAPATTADAADYRGLLRRADCFEDFKVDQVFLLGQQMVSRDEIVTFARRYDPQPVHIDDLAARNTILNGLAASGWHTCSMFMRLLCDGLLSRYRYAGLVAVTELKWRVPVRPGDALSGRVTCIGTDTVSRWPGLGVVTLSCEALNGHGQTVMSWHADVAFERHEHDRRDCRKPLDKARDSCVARIKKSHGIKYFEDVCVGDEIALGEYRFSSGDIEKFNNAYDPGSVHPAVVAATPACASGWHVAAIWMQKLVRYYMRSAYALQADGRPVPQLGPSPGVRHMNWHRPVHAGDLLTFTAWAERKISRPVRPGWGLLIGGAEATNQRGEVVVSFYAQLLLECRDRMPGPVPTDQ